VASQIAGSPRAVMSYSTAWIRKLRTFDLEWELAHPTLSTEGSRDELRRRLNEYVRGPSRAVQSSKLHFSVRS
jgi:hypothetical protein